MLLEIRHMMRAGGHAVIFWIAEHYDNYLFLNNCYENRNKTMINGIKYKGSPPINNVLYSYEHKDPLEKRNTNIINKVRQFNQTFIFSNPERILVIRDPLNWTASVIKYMDDRGETTGEYHLLEWKKYKKYFNTSFYTINYNFWFKDDDYKKQIEKDLGLEKNMGILKYVSKFGGGSSFNNNNPEKMDVLNRWKLYKDHPKMQKVFKDEELMEIAKNTFKMDI